MTKQWGIKRIYLYLLLGICFMAGIAKGSQVQAKTTEFTENGTEYYEYETGLVEDREQWIRYQYNSKKKTYAVVGVMSMGGLDDRELVVADKIKGKKVTAIADNAFRYNLDVKSIKLGKYVSSIGEESFAYSKKLESITMPSSVNAIGTGAFRGSALKSITIGKNIKTIGNYAFADCDKLTKVTIEKGKLKRIPNGCFSQSKALKQITLPSNVTTIGEQAFYRCEKLEKVTIKGKIKTIPRYCFYECKSLSTFTIPSTVTKIGDYAFSRTALTSVTIPKKVTTMEAAIFESCNSIKKVTIKGNVKELQSQVFQDCKALQSITISGNVKRISAGAFSNNPALHTVTISGNGTTVGGNSFSNCTGLKKVNLSGKITNVERYAFMGCSSLYQVVASKKVKEISEDAFPSDNGVGLTIVAPENSAVYDTFYESKKFNLTTNKKFGFNVKTSLMVAGESKQIATVNYDGKLKWKSSNPSILHITSNGIATAKAAGNVTLTASNSKQTFTLRMQVLPRTYDNIMRVITSEYVRPELSDYEKVVEANAWMIRNIKYDLVSYYNHSTTWAMCEPEYVLETGLAVCQGYAETFARIMSYYGIPCMITTSLLMNHAWNVVQIDGHWYHVDVTWNDPLSRDANGGVTNTNTKVWTSYLLLSDSEISDHYLYDFSCNTSSHDNVNKNSRTITGNSEVCIEDSPLNPYLNRNSITLAKGGDTFKLELTGTQVVSFKSKNKSIATVSKKGVITAKKKGTTTITAKGLNGNTYSCKVKVENPKINKSKITLVKGKSYALKVTGTSEKISWKSTNTKVVTVSEKGKIKAVGKGTAKVYTTVRGKKLTCTVTVHVHSYEAKVTKAATCTTDGVKKYTCACGDSYTKKIKAKGHNYKEQMIKEASCEVEGQKRFTCTRCNHSYTEKIEALEHDYQWFVTKNPSVADAAKVSDFGSRDLRCEHCKDVKLTESIIRYGGTEVYGYFDERAAISLRNEINALRQIGYQDTNGEYQPVPVLAQSDALDVAAMLAAVEYARTGADYKIVVNSGITVRGVETVDSVISYMKDHYNNFILRRYSTEIGIACFYYDRNGDGEYLVPYWVVFTRES